VWTIDPAHHGAICRIAMAQAPAATTVSSGGEGPEYGGESWTHLPPLTKVFAAIPAAPASPLLRGSPRMASIPNLVRPAAAFDPETIAVLSAALDEAWDPSSGREVSVPGPPMPVLCAKSLRGASSIWRSGAGSKRDCQGCSSFSCCELST
jgi:hypothetical protein